MGSPTRASSSGSARRCRRRSTAAGSSGWPRHPPSRAKSTRTSMPDAVRELTYGEAVREAIAEEMRRDPRVFVIGEDVAEAGHPFKTLVGLGQEFGTERIIDTPISQPRYARIGVRPALT